MIAVNDIVSNKLAVIHRIYEHRVNVIGNKLRQKLESEDIGELLAKVLSLPQFYEYSTGEIFGCGNASLTDLEHLVLTLSNGLCDDGELAYERRQGSGHLYYSEIHCGYQHTGQVIDVQAMTDIIDAAITCRKFMCEHGSELKIYEDWLLLQCDMSTKQQGPYADTYKEMEDRKSVV